MCGAAQAWPKSVSASVTASSDVAFLDVKWLKIVLCVSAKGCLTNGITSKIPWYLYQQEILLVLFAMESMKVVMQQFWLNKYQPIYLFQYFHAWMYIRKFNKNWNWYNNYMIYGFSMLWQQVKIRSKKNQLFWKLNRYFLNSLWYE